MADMIEYKASESSRGIKSRTNEKKVRFVIQAKTSFNFQEESDTQAFERRAGIRTAAAPLA